MIRLVTLIELKFINSSCSSFSLIVLLKLYHDLYIEGFEPTVSQSTVSSPILKLWLAARRIATGCVLETVTVSGKGKLVLASSRRAVRTATIFLAASGKEITCTDDVCHDSSSCNIIIMTMVCAPRVRMLYNRMTRADAC